VKTSKTDYKLFIACLDDWSKRMRLPWKIFTTHTELKHNHLAEMVSEPTAQHATIFLNTNWRETEITKKELDDTALHELLEVLLDELDTMARRSCSGDSVDLACHRVIQSICYLVESFRKNKK
jgi:hypothetical protein